MVRAFVGWLAGASCMFVIACASTKQASQAPAPASSGGPETVMMPGSSPREQIDALDRAIEDELTRMGVRPAPPPACVASASCSEAAPQPMSIKPVAEDPTCKPAPGDTCRDSCTLSDSICSNAGKICEIAKQLGGDDAYANEKCQRGTTSCELAHERCCSCM
ncbi:MAG: hypothetical protein JWP01_1718 [Myxococcales bacterium]|nr:hypothetical protein [Myxococcales bacterium]